MATNGVSTESYKAKEDISSEGILGNDIKTLVSNISKLSTASTLKNEEEVMKWVAFADKFPADHGARAEVLKGLNDEVILKTVLIGGGLNSSEADIVVYASLHSFMNDLSSIERQKYPNVLRWVDYIQNKEDFGDTLQKFQLEKIGFEFPCDTNPKKGAQNVKATKKPEAVSDSKKSDKLEADSKSKKSETEIDVGEGSVRQVVSGLANRRVVLITNVKPGKLRDVTSAGLVLCASSKDQTAVEPLLAPEGAKIGERVSISGHDEKPEDVLNPKKKQLDKITPASQLKGIPFMTSAGPCTSSIPNELSNKKCRSTMFPKVL
ncbi:hypothetical protein MKX01_012430 [Papaver californicum]|nr:hypothetical protein MKX01_012430 [Papaver californicum]